jgi:hypothetical protein
VSDQKRMPSFRLKYRDQSKRTFDVGTVWSGRFPDSYDVKPETKSADGQYPRMALSEAIRRVEAKDGWLSLTVVRSKSEQTERNQPRRTEPADEFGDDSDIPF